MDPSSSDQRTPAADVGAGGSRQSFREELDRTRYMEVDENWAGGVPAQYGVAPRVRIGTRKWFNLLWLIPIGLVLLIVAIATAKGIREIPLVMDFMEKYPGMSELPDHAPVGFPRGSGGSIFSMHF